MWLLRILFVSRALIIRHCPQPLDLRCYEIVLYPQLAILPGTRYVHTSLVQERGRARFLYLFCSHGGDLETCCLLYLKLYLCVGIRKRCWGEMWRRITIGFAILSNM